MSTDTTMTTAANATDGSAHTIVLVGHGMVGQRFLEALAERGLTATHRVVVLCEEPRPAYDRVQLTSYFSGRTPEELSLTDAEFITTHGIELHLGDPAETIDREARQVTARSGLVITYDTLVLATGSYPFVPPVPGKDAEGCFVYRTIEDLLAIEEYAKARATTGAVVGGGLLGLEAAGALKGLGLTTHIVEFAPRLMPVQVDEGGGAALLRTIQDMGLTVHTGTGTQEIVTGDDGAVTGMKLSDGSELPTDLVVFSAGVRPRDQLARATGLTVGERGGITVDDQCRTSDPHVFAIGECALASDGRVYGLVAPGYELAESAAATLAADQGRDTGAHIVTNAIVRGGGGGAQV
ncbi:FAD-dependent oxidoreductase, partial [Streptomyces sp. NPDC127044]